MGKELEKEKTVIIDDPMTPVPLNQRQHWTAPAFIFGGLEFSVTLLMIGSTLIGAFGLKGIIPVVLFTFICLTWVGNAISGYMGAKTGLSSSVIAKQGFGDKQAKFIIALVIGVISMGWWAVQTSVTGNAFCAVLGIDYTVNRTAWMITTIVAGILFAIPSVIGYSSMKWTDYFAVPGGILLCIVGIYLALKNIGWSNIISYKGSGEISFAAGVTMILGMNVSQFVISADYTRYAKPCWKDNILIPIGIVAIGIPLLFIGAIMGAGNGTADIVAVMENLGFPIWGFIVLWLAAWTSQLVNNYTMGLSFSNMLNIKTNKGRAIVTAAGTFLSLLLCFTGILENLQKLLSLAALLYPAIAGVMFVDFFLRKGVWEDKQGWNFMAKGTIVMHTSSQDEEALLKELSKLEEMLKAQFSETENLSFRLEKEEQKKEVTVFTKETVNLIIEAITFLPCGVISRTRENVEMVQTSSNIGSMTIQDGTLEFLCSGRSSVKLEKAQLKEKMQILSKALEMNCTFHGDYPQWEYRKESKLRDICAKTYREYSGKDAVFTGIHAGIECGYLAEKLGDHIDMISCGANLYDVHTPHEKADVESFYRMEEVIIAILQEIAKA